MRQFDPKPPGGRPAPPSWLEALGPLEALAPTHASPLCTRGERRQEGEPPPRTVPRSPRRSFARGFVADAVGYEVLQESFAFSWFIELERKVARFSVALERKERPKEDEVKRRDEKETLYLQLDRACELLRLEFKNASSEDVSRVISVRSCVVAWDRGRGVRSAGGGLFLCAAGVLSSGCGRDGRQWARGWGGHHARCVLPVCFCPSTVWPRCPPVGRQELEDQVLTDEMLKESETRAETPPEGSGRESSSRRRTGTNPLALAMAVYEEKALPSEDKLRQRREDAILQNKARAACPRSADQAAPSLVPCRTISSDWCRIVSSSPTRVTAEAHLSTLAERSVPAPLTLTPGLDHAGAPSDPPPRNEPPRRLRAP